MGHLVKTVKTTFASIFEFVNEVQEIQCIENCHFSYDLVHNIDIGTCSSYVCSMKKLCETLQSILKELQNSQLDIASSLIGSCNTQGVEGERDTGIPFSDQSSSEISFAPNYSLPLESLRTDKVKEGNLAAFQPCQTFSQSTLPNPFHKNDLRLQGKGDSELQHEQQYRNTLYVEPACPPSNLVAPFENLAINSALESPSICQTSIGSPIIGAGNSTFATPSIPHSSFSETSLNFMCPRSDDAPSDQREASKSTLNRNFNSYLKKCKKCNSFFVSKSSGSMKEECSSCSNLGEDWHKSKTQKSCSHNFATHNRIKCSKRLSLLLKKNQLGAERRELLLNKTMNDVAASVENLPIFCCKSCNSASSDLAAFHSHLCRLPNDDGNELSNRILVTDLRSLQEMKKFVCDRCRVEFRSLKRILYHLPRCLPGPYICHLCSSVFENLKNLNYHKKKSHGEEKCFTCDECGKEFLRKSSLRKHCINRHESKAFLEAMEAKDMISFRCDLCPKKFIKKIFLTNHKLRNHGLDKKFLCQVCGKKFMTNTSLMIHMDIHKGEKKFECKYCDRRFRRKEKLMYHERIHTGERPYECEYCDKAFVSKARLNEHQRRHEAEKRFECPKCDKTYASAWDLKKHMRKKHDSEVATQYVKVVLKRSDRFQGPTIQASKQLQHHGIHQPSLSQILTMNTNAESSHHIPTVHTSCQVHVPQIQPPSTDAASLSNIIIQPNASSVNMVVPFTETPLQGQCYPRLEDTPSNPSLLSSAPLQSTGTAQVLFQTDQNSTQQNQIEDYSTS